MPQTTLPTIFAQPALRRLLALATAAALPLLTPAFAQAATAPASILAEECKRRTLDERMMREVFGYEELKRDAGFPDP